MARPGVYILEIRTLKELSDRIVYSGEKMARIDESVTAYLNDVENTLERQLKIILMRYKSAVDFEEKECWKRKYKVAKRIYEKSQQEIADFTIGGHELVLNMCNRQTPKASQILNDCVERLREILSCTVVYRNSSDN